MKRMRLFTVLFSMVMLLVPLRVHASNYIIPEDYNGYEEVEGEVERLYTDDEIAKLTATSDIPARYDSREYGRVSGIRNQNPYGTCWSFSIMAALEGSVLSQGLASSVDLSEYHFLNYNYQSVVDPLGGTEGDNIVYNYTMEEFLNEGGNVVVAYHALTNWVGATRDTGYVQDPSYVMPKTIESAYLNDIIHLEQFGIMNKNDTVIIKQAIMEHGVITASYGHHSKYLNNTTGAYYNYDTPGSNHAVAIVGWDDNYSKENFLTEPSGDGAWLVKNSWGTWFGNDGFFWLSYEDVSLRDDMCYAVAAPADKYDHNYQYDGSYYNGGNGYQNVTRAANVFRVPENAKTEILEAISFETYSANVDYEVQIYLNPTSATNPSSGEAMLSTPIKGEALFKGFYTVEMPEDIILKPGDKFSVVITLKGKTPGYVYVMTEISADWNNTTYTASAKEGQSFVGNATGWNDYGKNKGGNVRIKAYTCDVDAVPVELIDLNYFAARINAGKTVQLTAAVRPINATNQELSWKSSDEAVAVVDAKGKVTAVGPGTATITVSATDGSGVSASCEISVTQLVTSITLNTMALTMTVGETETLTATVAPSNASNKKLTWKSSDETVATVDENGKVTAISLGESVITVSANDESGVKAICIASIRQPVTDITLNKSNLELNTGETATLTATVSPDNATNKALIWNTSDRSVATVDANGKVTAVGPGTATITATAKDESGVSANCEVTVNQPVTEVTLNKKSLNLETGRTEILTATVRPDNATNKAVIWKSTNKSVATVDANGKVTAVAPGTATITVTAADGSGESAGCEITVTQPVTDITLNKTILDLKTGETETLTATVAPENASNKAVTWKSSDEAVVTVNANGKVTAVAPGIATITVTAQDGSLESASCKVTVTRPVTGITLNKTSLSLKTGATETLTVTVTPDNASNKMVIWKSTNEKIAIVDGDGKVIAVAPGTATITVTAADGSGKSASCSVTVTQPVTGITLNKNSLNLETGAAETLTATVTPDNATNKAVTWKSSNGKVATVDANGKVIAVASGTATITVTAADGSGKSASCSVTVTQPVTGITLNKNSLSLKTGATEILSVTVAPENASNKAVTWKSSNGKVATVDANGKVTAVAPGTATITVTAADGSGKSANCSVTVTQPVTGITLNKNSLNLKTGATETLTATVTPDNASNKAVTWKSSNGKVATVDANGKVIAVAPGSATITVTAADGSGKSASCSVTVTQPVTGITLNKNSLNLETGAAETLTATVTPDNATNRAVTWKSSNGKVATVDASGKVIAVAPGTATITVTAADGSGISASCEVTVTAPVKFADVPESEWFYPYVKKAYDNGYMSGTGTDSEGRIIFKPLVNIPREQFVTVLYALEEVNPDSIQYSGRFSDVKESDWFAKPVEWAAQNGIVSGTGNGKFGVGQLITREQMALMLYGYARYKGYDISITTDISSFPDAGEVSSWAYDGMRWAIQNGIMSGQKAGDKIYLKPKDNASRAVCATMIVAFAEKY